MEAPRELVSLLRDTDKHPIRVALDIDETIATVLPLWLESLNKAKGTNFTVEDHKDYNFRSINSSYEEAMPHYVKAWVEQYEQIPFSGDVKQIMELTDYYTVHLLTTRSPTKEGATGGTVDAMHEWLRIKGLSGLHVEICDPSQNKATDFDYHIYIDDSPVLAKTIAAGPEGKFMLLIDHKYNEEIKNGPRVLHVANSKVATKLLLDLARREIAITRKIRSS